jgi:hypothetical protein
MACLLGALHEIMHHFSASALDVADTCPKEGVSLPESHRQDVVDNGLSMGKRQRMLCESNDHTVHEPMPGWNIEKSRRYN